MTPTTVEPADQPTTAPMAIAGSVATVNAATMKAALPAGSAAAYVFSFEAIVVYGGSTLCFRPGTGYVLDAALLAFLTANGITPTAV